MLRGIQRWGCWQHSWTRLQPKGTSAGTLRVKSAHQRFALSRALACMSADTLQRARTLSATHRKGVSSPYEREIWKCILSFRAAAFHSRHVPLVSKTCSPLIVSSNKQFSARSSWSKPQSASLRQTLRPHWALVLLPGQNETPSRVLGQWLQEIKSESEQIYCGCCHLSRRKPITQELCQEARFLSVSTVRARACVLCSFWKSGSKKAWNLQGITIYLRIMFDELQEWQRQLDVQERSSFMN